MSEHDCIIVGSGINALVCAAILAKKGKRVCVLERNDRFGGCIRTDEITAPGFTHDVLSSWYPLFVTSPGYGVLGDDLAARGVEFCNTDSPTAVILPNGAHFIFKRSRSENVEAMNAASPGDGDHYQQSMDELMQSLDLTFTLLGNELWTWSTAKVLFKALRKMGPHGLAQFGGSALRSCRSWLEDSFESEVVRACLAPWPPHAGIGPDAAVSGQMAKVICFALEAAGCPLVKGGSYQIVEAFKGIIEENGGEMHLESDVEGILTANGRADGVRLVGGGEHRCPVEPVPDLVHPV